MARTFAQFASAASDSRKWRSLPVAGALIALFAVSLAIGTAVLAGLPALVWTSITGRPLPVAPYVSTVSAQYVGAGACRECHESEFDSWNASHHKAAMQIATAATVLGDFNNAAFEAFGVTSTFFRQDDRFMVRTDGPDGALTEYVIEYTFGVFPLQQYLIAFPGGRYQALSIAWDSRPQAEGGQRWFHLYPDEKIDHGDQLHWTGRYQNWNMMCADCHSTDVRKGYDATSDTYTTTYSEINVGCEACHGAGSRHVDWARHSRPPYDPAADNGLEVRLTSGWADAWRFEPGEARFPVRDTPPSTAAINGCAPCHSRRLTIAEGGIPGEPLADTHRLSMLTEPLYYADGQQRDEVYVWGSFNQSRMHFKGVTCMDCHDPHSQSTRFTGNTLCARCHSPDLYDTPDHHFHDVGSTGAACTACHMPTQHYMVVDARLDHSIRVPRPDLTPLTGAPDACTMCHTDQSSAWAASEMDGWYPPSWRQRVQWGPTLAAGAEQGFRATPSLLELALDAETPAIVRATAGHLARPSIRADDLPVVAALLGDEAPTVRIAALEMLHSFDLSTRVSTAADYLSDPVRGVRIEVALLLADAPATALSAEQSAALDLALKEYETALRLNADWPAENMNKGNFALRRGRLGEAIAAFERAIELDPLFVGGYVNLADVHRATGRDAEGEQTLRAGLARLPESADLHHALGLLLVRRGDTSSAFDEFKTAADLAPENGRYAYVYAIALYSTGDVPGALRELRRASLEEPFDPEILGALVSILQERNAAGDRDEALTHARRLGEIFPDDPAIQQLIIDLERSR